MPIDPALRSLKVDVPAQPEVLADLSILLSKPDVNLQRVAQLIETDMALASAVLRAVNSALYGLKGRVQSVQQAITYLGTREVGAVTFELALRAVFPAAAELESVWERAKVRGLLMGRVASELGLDAWAAHSAGLFEECGKAVLFRHAPARYRPLLQAAADDLALTRLEHEAFGVSHDALGAAMCESWGLAIEAVVSVRHHVAVQATRQVPLQVPRRGLIALSAVAQAMMDDPEQVPEIVGLVAPQADLDGAVVLRGVHRVMAQIEQAVTPGTAEPSAPRTGSRR
ncbi:MAG: HDOD domain-containing protein [Ideonella sp.]|nr:HDOD domain-containing protein [Ideonella sp.]